VSLSLDFVVDSKRGGGLTPHSLHPTSIPSNKRVLWKDLNLGTDGFYIQTARETTKLKGQYRK